VCLVPSSCMTIAAHYCTIETHVYVCAVLMKINYWSRDNLFICLGKLKANADTAMNIIQKVVYYKHLCQAAINQKVEQKCLYPSIYIH
jgi:hypothetical protein